MDAVIIFTARYLIILLPLVLLQILWMLPRKEKYRFIALTILSLLLAYALAKMGTHFYENPRPFEVGNFEPLVPHGIENGFPSLHTTFAATFALLVFTRYRIMGVVLFIAAILIGAARVAAGVHHGIDVLAGLIVATLAVVLAGRLLTIRVIKY